METAHVLTAAARKADTWRLALVGAASAATLDAALSALDGLPDDGLVQIHTDGARTHRGALLVGEQGASPVLGATGEAGARPVALLFPGLGDHYLNMGRDLYRDFPVFQGHVDRCAEILRDELGFDLREVIFTAEESAAAQENRPRMDLRGLVGRQERARSPQEERLDRTSVAQPALFVIEYALAKLWQTWGAQPEVMIGYSLGEYVAACLAGVLSLEDSLRLVARRARLIESLPEGAMLAVMLPESEVLGLLGEQLSLSAVNGPEFCVVAGPVAAIDELAAQLSAREVVTRRVRSSHAFHSAMMAPIADEVTRLVATFQLNPPSIPYVSNVTGELVTAEQATDPSYWAQHLCNAVRFADGLATVSAGAVLLEAGPGQTLSSMAAPARPDSAAVIASMRHSLENRSDTATLLKAVGRLWVADGVLDWDRLPSVPLAVPAGVTESTVDRELTATERRLTEIWEKLLATTGISPQASFFDVGGNSLLATRLILRVSRAFDVDLTLRQIYQDSTVSAMAAVIDGGASTSATEALGADRPRYRLPNGLWVAQQNEAETKHFYEDIFDHRTYAKHGITIRPGATVVDVGGNIGLFTLFAHYEAADVRVFTFEPAPPMFELLSGNVAEHGVNAELFNIGISDREATAEFTFYPRSSGMSSFHPDTDEEKHNLRTIIANQRAAGAGESDELLANYAEELFDVRFEAVPFTARLRPLSAVIAEQGIERIDLIKIDVQKSEHEVIAGIAEQDWPKIQQMVLEAHDGDGRVGQLVDLLRSKGFRAHAEQDELYVGTDIHNIYAIRDDR